MSVPAVTTTAMPPGPAKLGPTGATPTPTPTPTPAGDPGARGPDGLPAEIPATKSAPPSVAEWNAAREITVRRSTPLGCETKMVREWLRVSCRGKNDKGGTPLVVNKTNGCGADTFFSSSGGVTSVVTPVRRGGTCDVSFGWTIGGAALWVRWPNGAARPTIAFQD